MSFIGNNTDIACTCEATAFQHMKHRWNVGISISPYLGGRLKRPQSLIHWLLEVSIEKQLQSHPMHTWTCKKSTLCV